MFEERARSLQTIAALLDVACISAAFVAAYFLRPLHTSLPLLGSIPATVWEGELHRADYAVALLTNILVWLTYVRTTSLYRPGRLASFRGFVVAYLQASVLSVFVTGAVVFGLQMSISRIFFVYFLLCALLLLTGKQLIFSRVVRRAARDPSRQRGALVIGPSGPGRWVLSMVKRAAGYRPVGLLIPDACGEPLGKLGEGAIVGSIAQLDKVLEAQVVDEVFIVGSGREISDLGDIVEELVASGRVVSIVPIALSGAEGVSGRVTTFQDVAVVRFGPVPRDDVQAGLKRVLDVAVSASLMIVLSPIALLVGALIRAFDPGPLIFAQERLGLRGRRFRLYKFRSMRVDAEAVLMANPELHQRYRENGFKLPSASDPRITRLGRILRKTSLDELPQLWNVLRGDMTLVGPRPIVPDEIAYYGDYADMLLSVRPGLTGHWQVSGRSEVPYPDRAFLDLDYVSDHSLSGDLRIMARTLPAVLRRNGAA